MKFTSTPMIVAAITGGMAVLPAVSAVPHPSNDGTAAQDLSPATMPKGIPPARGMGAVNVPQTTGWSNGNVGLAGRCTSTADCSLHGVDTTTHEVKCAEDLSLGTGERICLMVPIQPEEKKSWLKRLGDKLKFW